MPVLLCLYCQWRPVAHQHWGLADQQLKHRIIRALALIFLIRVYACAVHSAQELLLLYPVLRYSVWILFLRSVFLLLGILGLLFIRFRTQHNCKHKQRISADLKKTSKARLSSRICSAVKTSFICLDWHALTPIIIIIYQSTNNYLSFVCVVCSDITRRYQTSAVNRHLRASKLKSSKYRNQ